MLASEIVARAVSGWPYDAVDYSQSGIWNDDDGPGPHIGGYRRDCSGFATMAGGGPTPGYSTVTMLSSGWVRPISWAELAPGDFVGALGPGTAGDAGHVMVVITVDHTANTYEVLEQAGYGPGPDRNTYRIGDGQKRNYLPYRLSNLINPEDDVFTFLRKGDGPKNGRADAIRYVQQQLRAAGAAIDVTGVYDDPTAKAIVDLRLTGGDQSGATFGDTEAIRLLLLIVHRWGGGTADPDAIYGAVRDALDKVTATTTLQLPEQAK